MTWKSVREALRQAPALPPLKGRVEGIDLARGIAIALMIVSHAVSGIFGIRNVPDWGMVPIHLLTKFSSSLFIVVFGVALALAFLTKTEEPDWPRRRRRLMLRGVEVFICYKALTVVEMLPFFPAPDILDALLYQRFPIWVDILGFYAIALLWLPWALPYWRRMPLWARLALPVAITLLSGTLERHFNFFGSDALKAILVEDADYYTWGQLSRLPLVLLGLLIGEVVIRTYSCPDAKGRFVLAIGGAGFTMLLGFMVLSLPGLAAALMAVAWNEGKHPPELPFMLFSLGGALLILGLCLRGSKKGAWWLRPITLIGSEPLGAFIFHIVVIFLGFRFLLEESLASFTYPQVLLIGIALVPATAAWIAFSRWADEHRKVR